MRLIMRHTCWTAWKRPAFPSELQLPSRRRVEGETGCGAELAGVGEAAGHRPVIPRHVADSGAVAVLDGIEELLEPAPDDRGLEGAGDDAPRGELCR